MAAARASSGARYRTSREATYPGPFNGLQTAGIPGITAAYSCAGEWSLVDRGNAVHTTYSMMVTRATLRAGGVSNPLINTATW